MQTVTFKIKNNKYFRAQTIPFTSYSQLVKDIYTAFNNSQYGNIQDIASRWSWELMPTDDEKEYFDIEEIELTEQLAKEFLARRQYEELELWFNDSENENN